jgi:hypothetical protein
VDFVKLAGTPYWQHEQDPPMTTPPLYAQDYDRLGADGFLCDNIWYHGTSSALAEKILTTGLKRSGDSDMNNAVQNTMATIGDNMGTHEEPLFLCPAKSLAWYWALQTVHKRHTHLGTDEQPVIIAITMPDELAQEVKPDVGAASILMHPEGEDYLAYLCGIYQARDLPHPNLEPVQAERMDYLKKLGLAYFNGDLDCSLLQQIGD